MSAVLAAAATIAITGATISSAAASSSGEHAAARAATTTPVAAPARAKLTLAPSSAALAACFPHAKARVVVDLTTDTIGKDTFRIYASGLKPKTSFTVFLLQQATPTFGAAEYIGDITTDQWGNAHNEFKLIVQEAFAFNGTTAARVDLNSVGFWFADPADDDSCLGAASPTTGFDGDASAGVQMMNSGTQALPLP
ncbi:MAG: hypothetical protein DLM59_05550 [Pseudonocardiales bacterium]|nr:MAG: hypothetical protein DLM59_05550 [Pseudonocardiales bacterium]